MGKHHFTIRKDDKPFKCYLDEDGRLYLRDVNGEYICISATSGIDNVEVAKEMARAMLDSLKHDK